MEEFLKMTQRVHVCILPLAKPKTFKLLIVFFLLSVPLYCVYFPRPDTFQHTVSLFSAISLNIRFFNNGLAKQPVEPDVGLVNSTKDLSAVGFVKTKNISFVSGTSSDLDQIHISFPQSHSLNKSTGNFASRPSDHNHATNQRAVCDLEFLKHHAQQYRNYAKLPFTQINATTTVPPRGEYDCWFDDSQVNSSRMAQCDTNTGDNVRSILQFGDSNGRFYAEAFISNLAKRGWTCNIVKQEQPAKAFMPDPKYFVKPPFIHLADIRVSQRSCHRCVSFLARCSRANRTLTYEYLALQFFSDNEVTTNRIHHDIYNSSNQLTSFQNSSSTTQQEFIFREYLADRYPDVVIYFVSSHFRHKLDDVQPLAASFFDTIERHLPPTSRVIIASSMKRVYGTAHKHLSNILHERNFTANDMQLWLNARVYDAALARLVDPVKRWYAFPSLYDVSNTTDQMYADHVHRTPIWYQSITRYLLKLICLY